MISQDRREPSHDGSRAGHRRPAPGAILLLALWFGMLTGFAEAANRLLRKVVFGKWLFAGPQLVWMAPVAEAAIFAALAIVLVVLGRRWPRIASPQAAVLLFTAISVLSVLLLYPSLHKLAAVLLASGIAFQVFRFITPRLQAFQSLVRRTFGWAALLVIGLAAGVYGWERLTERTSLARMGAAPHEAPNVLLIVLDTVRAQDMSLYGYARQTTPHLAQLAKTGTLFQRALAPAPWTVPSHATLFTGRFPHELFPEKDAAMDARYPTLAERLAARGYLTAGFVANMDYAGYETGLGRGFAHFEDFPVSLGELVLSSALAENVVNSHRLRRFVDYQEILVRKSAADVNRDFLRWLSPGTDDRPFFAFLNYYDAHQPYRPPEPFAEAFGNGAGLKYMFWSHQGISQQQIQRMSPVLNQEAQAAYDGTIAYLDTQVSLLLEELHRRKVLAKTLVVITSDHGEQFGEHDLVGHANSLYRPVLHVPLMILSPGRVPAGQVVAEPVTLRDVPATILDLIGLRSSAGLPGRSLARTWEGAAPPDDPGASPLLSNYAATPPARAPELNGTAHSHSLVEGRYHYIRSADGRDELYEFQEDPGETRNLAGSMAGRQELERLRGTLARILAGPADGPAAEVAKRGKS